MHPEEINWLIHGVKITLWELTVKERGATISDISKLETSLRFPMTVMTITGKVLYESKYKSKGAPIKIIDHNKHAWTSAVTIFPRNRTIKHIPEEFLVEEFSKDGFLVEKKTIWF